MMLWMVDDHLQLTISFPQAKNIQRIIVLLTTCFVRTAADMMRVRCSLQHTPDEVISHGYCRLCVPFMGLGLGLGLAINKNISYDKFMTTALVDHS